MTKIAHQKPQSLFTFKNITFEIKFQTYKIIALLSHACDSRILLKEYFLVNEIYACTHRYKTQNHPFEIQRNNYKHKTRWSLNI